MFILVADEAVHQQTDPIKFFIYGGLLIQSSSVQGLTDGVEEIRTRYGFRPDDAFKFSPNDKPKGIDREAFLSAKREALKLARGCGAQFIGYAVLHAIARSRSPEELGRVDKTLPLTAPA